MLDISRNKDKIICNASIKEAITKWMKNRYYEFDDFSRIIDEIGLKTPITLESLHLDDDNNEEFKCTTADNIEVIISISFPDIIKIIVNKENKKEIFDYGFLYNYNCDQSIIKINNKKIITDNKTITNYYDSFNFNWLLEFDSSRLLLFFHTLNNAKLLENSSIIEDYLLSLDNKIDITIILNNIIKLAKLTENDLPNLEELLIQYDYNKIVLKYGEIIEYKFHDIQTHEYFHVFKDGSWNYISNTLSISFHSIHGIFNFNFSGQENFIENFGPKEALESVKKKMQPFFNLVNQSYTESLA